MWTFLVRGACLRIAVKTVSQKPALEKSEVKEVYL